MSLKLIELQNGKIAKTDADKVFEAPALSGPAGDYLMAKRDGSDNLTRLYDNGESGAERRVYYFTKS